MVIANRNSFSKLIASNELSNVPSLLSVVTFLHSSLSWCADAGSDTSDVTVLRGTLDAAAFVKLASMVMEVQYRSTTNEMEVPQPIRLSVGSKQIHIPALPPSWTDFVSLYNKRNHLQLYHCNCIISVLIFLFIQIYIY